MNEHIGNFIVFKSVENFEKLIESETSYSIGDVIYVSNDKSSYIKINNGFVKMKETNSEDESKISKSSMKLKICDKDFCPYFKENTEDCITNKSCILKYLDII